MKLKKKILAYGVWASQKTLQIRHLIEKFGADKVGIVSVDDGLPTIESSLNHDLVRHVDNLTELRAIWPWIEETFTSEDYWLCFDGGSRLFGFVAEEHMGRAEKAYDLIAAGQPLPDDIKRYGKFTTEKERDGHRGFESMGVYGLIGKGIGRLIDNIKMLPCNIYMNMLEDLTESDGRRKLPPLGPDLPGKMGVKIVMSTFDYVLRMAVQPDGSVTAFTRGSNQFLAKTREDRAAGVNIPPAIEKFRLDKFVEMISVADVPREALEFHAERAN